MKRLRFMAIATILALSAANAPAAEPSEALEIRAAALAKSLASACPLAAYGDEAAFESCAGALRTMDLSLEPAIGWGGDQPDKQIKKTGLTHFNSQVFQTMYLPLYVFTGRWSIGEDRRSHIPIIRLEAYFRNTLPPGDYPYPFWHSADKWAAYEASNELNFYIGGKGLAFVVTRGTAGSNERRGSYAHTITPAFDGAWQWRDANGVAQPRVSLFGAAYSPANPYLADLDKAYRAFALRARDEACLDCHTPFNKAEADRLVLLQTPRHAAGEIDAVIKAVNSKEMPQDDIGLPKDMPAERRTAMLAVAMAFREELARADRWEAVHPH